jgi:vacuolar-type H+-ATPase subunit D/Vma8
VEDLRNKLERVERDAMIVRSKKEELMIKFSETLENLQKVQKELSDQLSVNQKLSESFKRIGNVNKRLSDFQKESDRNYEEIMALKQENFDLKSQVKELTNKNEHLMLQNRKLIIKWEKCSNT